MRFRQFVSSVFAMLAVVLMLAAGACPAVGQACPAQNWTSGANVWAAEGSIKVLQANQSGNLPTIPVLANAGTFNPWGSPTLPELNPVYSCPSGTPVISVAGAGREVVSFQVFITANSALSNVAVGVSPLSGPGTTLTSDMTGTSNVTRYLEGYIPITYYAGFLGLPVSGNFPDPLIPFYDPYDAGNPAVATPFNVPAATTQGVWVNVSIPANQTAGTYTGTVTVSGNGVNATIPVNLTVWNGNLPRFDSGSVNPAHADMLKAWIPIYPTRFKVGEGLLCSFASGGIPSCPSMYTLAQRYQVMGHAYDFDTAIDQDHPYPLNPSPSTDPTSFSLDWTSWDALNGPALTPGGLFADGTNMQVAEAPFVEEWNAYGTWSWGYGSGTLPPAGMLTLMQSYSTQISQHYAQNHTNKGWGTPELLGYVADEPDGKLGTNANMYTITEEYAQAINQANQGVSWINPVRTFVTASVGYDCNGVSSATCTEEDGLVNPSVGGVPNSWLLDWVPNAREYEPGPSSYSPDYTVAGVAKNSSAPLPIENWFYQGSEPMVGGNELNNEALSFRNWFWIAYKYGVDQTTPSVGDPNPAAPAPGGVFLWAANFWGSPSTGASPTNCSISPYFEPWNQGVGTPNGSPADGVMFYPGNELVCYNTANSGGTPVGANILPQPLAVNNGLGCSTTNFTACNGISGPVASMRMEAWRRGYEDYEYLYLLRQKDAATATAVVNSMGGGGLTSWNALDWQLKNPYEHTTGVNASGYACTNSGAGVPYGPTGAWGCPGEWTHNPGTYASARVELATDLGWVPGGTPQAATPTFSPAGGTYTSAQTVTISDATSGATIYYTTNGTTPTTSSTVYSGPIAVSTTETVEAIATASGYTQSAVGSATYTINTATPASIAVSSGSGQSSPVNTAFPNPLVVIVEDANGNPVSGVTVNFAAGSGITVSSSTATTNSSGLASVTATPTTASTSLTVTASVAGVSTPATFTETGTAATGSALPIAGGGYYVGYAVKGGTVWAWGAGANGQLGNGGTANSDTPVQVSSLTSGAVVAAGYYTGYVLNSNGTVSAWGDNNDGQLGNGTTTNSSTPVSVSLPSGVTATAVGSGTYAAYAVDSAGTVYAWGSNGDGALGNGGTANSSTPVLLSNLTGVTAVAGNTNAGYALESNGTVWAWGDNVDGELGNGTTTNSKVPVQVQFPSGTVLKAIAAGSAYGTFTAYALDSNGNVWAWGAGVNGALGNGGTANSSTPVQVSNLTGMTAIGAGYQTGYAVKSDGTAWAWGDNAQGQLGNGTTTNSSTPVQVSNLTGVIMIASGDTTGYAAKGDGTVWAWGAGAAGALGNGSTANSSTPVQVSSF